MKKNVYMIIANKNDIYEVGKTYNVLHDFRGMIHDEPLFMMSNGKILLPFEIFSTYKIKAYYIKAKPNVLLLTKIKILSKIPNEALIEYRKEFLYRQVFPKSVRKIVWQTFMPFCIDTIPDKDLEFVWNYAAWLRLDEKLKTKILKSRKLNRWALKEYLNIG